MPKKQKETTVDEKVEIKENPNAIQTATTTAVAEPMDNPWGCEDIDPNDVLIPKLLLMQGLSDFVSQGKANIGDIVKSVDGQVVAPRGEKLAFIPLNTFKSWRIMEKEGDRFEWRKNEPWTAENEHRDLQWTELGNEWRADRTLNFYVLLVQDLKKEREAMAEIAKGGAIPDGDVVVIPCLLQFIRSSYNTGRQLLTEFAKAKKFKCPPASWTFNLFSETQTKDKTTYHVFSVERAGVTSKEDLAVAYEWYQTIATKDIKVHEASEVEASSEEPPPAEYEPGAEEGAQF